MSLSDRINLAVQRSIDAHPVPWLAASVAVGLVIAAELVWLVLT